MPYNVQGMSVCGLIEGRDSGMRLVRQGQAVRDDGETVTVRTENYAFCFGDDGNLVHILDRRVDAGEDENLWEREGRARRSVEHSLRDGRET